MKTEKRDFKGIWIPKEIWLLKDISIIEKCLFVEIDSLDNEEGCFAGNKYFAEFFGISTISISNHIKKLKEKGYIKQISFDGRKRKLKSCLNISLKTGLKKTLKQCLSKVEISNKENFKHNNIINNTNNKNKDPVNLKNNSKEEQNKNGVPIPSKLNTDLFKKTWADFLEHRKQTRKKMTQIAKERMLKKLSTYKVNIAIAMLEQSIENGYQGVFELKNNNYQSGKDDWLNLDD